MIVFSPYNNLQCRPQIWLVQFQLHRELTVNDRFRGFLLLPLRTQSRGFAFSSVIHTSNLIVLTNFANIWCMYIPSYETYKLLSFRKYSNCRDLFFVNGSTNLITLIFIFSIVNFSQVRVNIGSLTLILKFNSTNSEDGCITISSD